MRSQKNLTRKRVKIPPSVAEQGVNLLEFLIEAGGARKTKKKTCRSRKFLKRR